MEEMNAGEETTPNKKAEATNAHTSGPQPLRTLKGDLARLTQEGNLSEKELRKIDRDLLTEIRNYQGLGGDEGALKTLDVFKEKAREPISIHTKEEDLIATIEKTKGETLAKEMPRARKRTEDMRRALSEQTGIVIPPEKHEEKIKTAAQVPLPIVQPARTPIFTQPKTHPIKKVEPQKIEEPKVIVASPPPLKEPTLEEKLKKDEERLLKALSLLPEKERALGTLIERLQKDKVRLSESLAPLLLEEKNIEDRVGTLDDEREKTSDEQARREIEERRWKLADQRREIEERRWKLDQEIIKLQDEGERARREQKNVAEERAKLEEEQRKIEQKKRALQAVEEKKTLTIKLDAVEKEKEPIELEWIKLNEKRNSTVREFEKTGREEEGIRAKKHDIELEEKSAEDPEQKHAIEVERWKTEEELRVIEKKHWDSREELEQILATFKMLQSQYKRLLEKEKEITTTLAELEKITKEASL